MNAKLEKLWKHTKLNRLNFLGYMIVLRILFDKGANSTHYTIWPCIIFLVYAVIQLFLIRARVRDFGGKEKAWTIYYSICFAFSLLLVFLAEHPVLAFSLFHVGINFSRIFNLLLLPSNVYLCIVKSKDGEYIRDKVFDSWAWELIPKFK